MVTAPILVFPEWSKEFHVHVLGNEEHSHTKTSRREEERFKQESKWQSKHTVHRDFTMETQTRKPTFLEHISLLFSYSFRMKGYIPNLGLHLRHNQHHTFFLYTRTTLYAIKLHLHDQHPLNIGYSMIIEYHLQHYNTPYV
jgi:hypothetical protein